MHLKHQKRMMKFKTVKWNTGSAAARFQSTRKKIKENRKKNKSASSQAGGPAPDKSGHKQLKLTSDKLIGYYKIMKAEIYSEEGRLVANDEATILELLYELGYFVNPSKKEMKKLRIDSGVEYVKKRS